MGDGHSDAEGPPDGADLDSKWARWAADERLTQAGQARARERWLRQQATEEATFTGLLRDLAERRAEVVVTTTSSRHPGQLVGVGHDFCVVAAGHGTTLVALAAVAAVATPTASVPAAGDRSAPLDQRLVDVLGDLAAERSPVRLQLRGGQLLSGDLISVGTDVISLRLEGAERRMVHAVLAAVETCTSR